MCEIFRISIEYAFYQFFHRLNILKYYQNRQYKIYLNIRAMSNKCTIEKSLTHSSNITRYSKCSYLHVKVVFYSSLIRIHSAFHAERIFNFKKIVVSIKRFDSCFNNNIKYQSFTRIKFRSL